MTPVDKTCLISVCVCTYRRTTALRELLGALAIQEGLSEPFEIVIVDNDAAGSGKETVQRFRNSTPELSVRYFVEPQKNIARARNRSVAEAKGKWVAFIDDDEVPEPTWLRHLFETAHKYKADGVFAPVLPMLPKEAPEWIHRGRFFERPRHNTGEDVPVPEMRTGNSFLLASWLEAFEAPFDAQYGLTGGSDTHFFARVLANGARFVWCDEAIVYETISPSMANLRWLLLRSLRGGQTFAERKLAEKGKLFGSGLLIWTAATLALALMTAPLLLPFGVHRSVWWLRKGATAAGKLLAFTPYRYEEYGTKRLKRPSKSTTTK
ncbi:MAG: glycosyltransferase [Gammaproteobacteria bacterium]